MTKHLRFLFVALLMAVYAVGGYAQTTTTIWEEDWSSAKKDALPKNVVNSNATYTSTGSGTKVYEENLAGGKASPELLIAKNNGSWTVNVSNLDEYVGGTLTLSYSANKTLNITANGNAVKMSKNAKSYTGTFTLSKKDLTLVFTNTSTSNNVRIDDIVLTGTKVESGKQNPDLSFSSDTPTELNVNGTLDLSKYLVNPHGLEGVTYSADPSDVVSFNGTTITAKKEGTAKILASYAGNDEYTSGSASITLNVKDNRLDPELSFSADSYIADINEETLSGVEFVNPHGVEVEFTTDNENVIYDENEKTVMYPKGTAATYKITATFAGNDTYKSGETSCTIVVKDKSAVVGDLFHESFDNCNGTGGNDGKFSGSIANSVFKADKNEWAVTKVNAAKECIKVSASGNMGAGSATTPSIDYIGKSKLSFKIASWTGDKSKVTISVSNGTLTYGTTTASSVELTPSDGAWDDVEMDVNTSAAFTLSFSSATKNRFFLDEVMVTSVKSTPSADTYTYSETDETNNVKVCSNATVTIERTLVKSAWNTICLPFALDAAQITEKFGEGTKVAELNYENTTGTTVAFSAATKMDAGMPYLIMPTEDAAKLTFENVEITKTTPDYTLGDNTIAFKGTYSKTDINADTDIEDNGFAAFLGSDNTLHKAKEGSKLRGFRAYFVVPAALAGTPMNVAIDGVVTSLKNIDAAEQDADAPVYNLQGQRVDGKTLTRGIYVKAGKKFVVK